VTVLDSYQAVRDQFEETLFFAIYENPFIKMLYPDASAEKKQEGIEKTGIGRMDKPGASRA
jgi:hypothetical protein